MDPATCNVGRATPHNNLTSLTSPTTLPHLRGGVKRHSFTHVATSHASTLFERIHSKSTLAFSHALDRNYQRIDNGVGVTFQLDYGFRVDYEHVFTSSTDNLGDMNLVRLRYDF